MSKIQLGACGARISSFKTLMALREHGSLVAAAADLCLTPSAISHQLKELDHWYGVEVVNRRSRPVTFSNVGQRLLKLADDVLPQVQSPKPILLVSCMVKRDVSFFHLNAIAVLIGLAAQSISPTISRCRLGLCRRF